MCVDMTVKDFIKKHREYIDHVVRDYYGIVITNDRQRKAWILDDEGLYRLAHIEGVNI